VILHRYAESAALVPLLHVRPGPTVVRVAGPLSALLAAEALRWRDTTEVWVDQPIQVKDSRIKLVPVVKHNDTQMFNHVNFFDVVLLSPDMDPEPFAQLLKKGGLIQASTYTDGRVIALRNKIKQMAGAAVPYREYLPETLWFVIGTIGSMPRRVRRPPDGAKRVTERFLPALFSFGKDEIPLVFGPGEKS
jgi:hypothetical protein